MNFPTGSPAAVGYKLLSGENKDRVTTYTMMSAALSPLDKYVSEVHYVSTLIEGTTTENNDAFENYMFSFMIENSYDQFVSKINQNLSFYKDFPAITSRIRAQLAKIPELEIKYRPLLKDALLAYDYFENVPGDKALEVIEANNALLFTAFQENKIPKLSFPHLLFFSGRGLTHHDVVSEKVNQTYFEIMKQPDLHAMTVFMLADRYYTNNKLKDNLRVVEVMDVALSRKRELSNPQVVSLMSKKVLALQQLQSYEAFTQGLEELKPLIKNLENPELIMEALIIITVHDMVYDQITAEKNVSRMEALLLSNPGLKNAWKATVVNYRSELNNVSEPTESTDTADEYFELSLRKLKKMDYKGMVPLLLKAKELMDAERKAGGVEVQKETELLYTRILTDLMGSHVKIGEATEALKYAEMFKNKELNLLLGGNSGEIKTVQEIQNALAPDEALIYYVSTGTLDSSAYFNFWITRDDVKAGFFNLTKIIGELFNFLPDHIAHVEKGLATKELRVARNTERPRYDENYDAKPGDMRIFFELYRSYLHPQKEDKPFHDSRIFNILTEQLWENLIPNKKLLIGKTKLIISPAGDLSFIPFEVMKNSITGRHMVEDYEISYTPSATVLVSQRSEKPRTFKKNMLAFGDAKYSLRQDRSFPIKSIADVKRAQLAVKNSISKNENLDYAYAGMQGEDPMKYLVGTKKEVEAISQLIEKTDVRMDDMMTENELKKLSKSGALKDYKVIHIASHASVHPYVFEMSSIAMSVKPSPVDGEDGMLTVGEMKELDMNPELVMLSACQTGLGRITTGDTVQGLNNSLLQAGADATLTSLWSVNDYATSVFVTEFYDRVFNKNVPYKTAVTEVKREFLAGKHGEQLKHPEYWAPFIYYGK